MNFKLSKIEVCDAGKGELFEFVEILRHEHKASVWSMDVICVSWWLLAPALFKPHESLAKKVYYSTKNLKVE